jgi:hypothetical protein
MGTTWKTRGKSSEMRDIFNKKLFNVQDGIPLAAACAENFILIFIIEPVKSQAFCVSMTQL